jgi:hypothetical protein
MKQFLLSIYQPDGPPPPPAALEKIMRDVVAQRDKLRQKGALVLEGGLLPASAAKVARAGDGASALTDGPFTEAKEHVGGLMIVKAEDLDQALAWAGELARATTLPIEVRAFQA